VLHALMDEAAPEGAAPAGLGEVAGGHGCMVASCRLTTRAPRSLTWGLQRPYCRDTLSWSSQMNVPSIFQGGDEFVAALMKPDGSIGIPAGDKGINLRARGFVPHEAEFDELCAALAVVGKTSLLPCESTLVTNDHRAVWGWTSQLLLMRPYWAPGALAQEDERLIRLAAGAALQNRPEELGYLSFPMIEVALKRALSTQVSIDGTALVDLKVRGRRPKIDAKQRVYIAQLLGLFLDAQPSRAGLQAVAYLLDRVDQIEASNGGAIWTIANWRNGSLHGSRCFGGVGCAMFSLALLINLSNCRGHFEAWRDEQLERLRRHPGEPIPPSEFYRIS